MKTAAATRLFIVWLGLSGVSMLQLWFSPPGGPEVPAPSYAITFAVIVLALVKVRFIVREFMEVRHAPALLMRLTDLWILLSAVALLGTYCIGMTLSARA
jgi:hypothetical protein